GTSDYAQQVATFWVIKSWDKGKYTLMYDGKGKIMLSGIITNIEKVDDKTYTFVIGDGLEEEAFLQIVIEESSLEDPIRNMRVIIPGALESYQTNPFNPKWLEKLNPFKTVRFMDWGGTNSWGQPDNWTWDDTTLFKWDDRAKLDYYTYASPKGVPYELMIKLLNDYDLDGWVCVPHRASDDYIKKMAEYFRDNLEPDRKLYVEYSNEIWNWIFGQTHWLYKYGCEDKGIDWPEGIVPYVQNNLDIWTEVFQGQQDRIVRVVGLFTAWQDVSNRIVFNLRKGSFDALAPTFYFGLSDEGDAELDSLGEMATASDVAYYVRQNLKQSFDYIKTQKETIADSLDLPFVFYEGGQHVTPLPFGVDATYEQALLDFQRDTSIYNIYTEWFDSIRNLNTAEIPWLMNHFSFITRRSAKYGSWGLLEEISQDTSVIPAPKYKAVLEAIEHDECNTTANTTIDISNSSIEIWPNPAIDEIVISGLNIDNKAIIELFDLQGRKIFTTVTNGVYETKVDIPETMRSGFYFVRIIQGNSITNKTLTIATK
ncbi:MAG TPA: T9SS type A sorting domain-containing protein, partial [Bacteroidetes bacterium]|nr:T9SS type A sorting domain-containing protein [Bacteroidota bacterium]